MNNIFLDSPSAGAPGAWGNPQSAGSSYMLNYNGIPSSGAMATPGAGLGATVGMNPPLSYTNPLPPQQVKSPQQQALMFPPQGQGQKNGSQTIGGQLSNFASGQPQGSSPMTIGGLIGKAMGNL